MTETLDQIAKIIHDTLPKSAGVAIAMTTTAEDVPGWDSLSHVKIILGVEKAFKIRIRTTEMAKLDNVGALVELVTARLQKMIHTLRAGSGAAFVCVHPVDGQIAHYEPLAAALQWPGPILGVSAEPGIASFAALAAQHAAELAAHRPTALLGWAMGGVLAAEIARSLPITRLVVLDSRVPVPEMRTRPTDDATIRKFFVFQRAQMFERTAIQPASYDTPAIFAALREAGTLGDITEADLDRRIAIVTELTRAFFQHEMQPLPLTVDLFESTESLPSHPKPPTLGWEAVAARVVHHAAAGNHFSLLAPARCAALSATLNTL